MGGHKSGEYASETVLAEMSKAIKTIPGNLDFVKLKNNLKEIINSVHFILLDEGFKDPNKFKMGSTFVGLMLYNNKLYLINIGDSRFYRFREGILSQISRDHSLKDMTGIDDISKNIITNSFGGGENIFFDLDDITDRITSNDTIVICSDGLSNEIGDEDIEKLLSQSIDPIALVEASKNSGGNDNISIIIISINKDEFPLEKGEKN
jgi:protein phosphatase